MRIPRTLAISLTTLAAGLAIAVPAHAGTDGPGGAVSEGGSVKVTWTWAGPGSIKDVDMEVRDSRCDAQGTYARMVFEQRNANSVEGEPRWNRIGCNGAQPFNNLEFRSGFDVTGFFVKHCTDSNSNNKADPGDHCGRSGVVDNPKS